jgi:hypothetical protein
LLPFDPQITVVTQPQERLLSGRAFVDLVDAVLDKGADFRMRATGMSMHPFIREGDIITLRRVPQSRLRIGDIVALPHPERGNLVVHRIIGRSGGVLHIKGDSNWHMDGRVNANRVLGRVIRVERAGSAVRPGYTWLRLLIAWCSNARVMRPIRFSVYKRLLKLGEFY